MNKFSIVVFAKNEECNIRFVIEELLQKYTADKIIFVLDGNIGPTAGILSEKGVGFIKGPDMGKGAAIRIAINDIESDILILMDADGSHNPDEIENLLNPLADDKVKIVIGSRFMGSSEELDGNVPNSIRWVGNKLGNAVINSFWNRTGKDISDAQNGFRSIQRQAFLTLAIEEKSFSIEQEMVIKCLKKGYKICEVPSFERKRKYGRSHISAKHLIDFVGCIIRNI